MAEDKLPTRAEDFAEWYNKLVLKADMADYSPVRGCMVVKPYGWTLWEKVSVTPLAAAEILSALSVTEVSSIGGAAS